MRTEAAETVSVICHRKCGRYVVQVFWQEVWLDRGEYVYRVLLDGRKVLDRSEADGRAFPKTAAKLGAQMVQEVKSLSAEIHRKELALALQGKSLPLFAGGLT